MIPDDNIRIDGNTVLWVVDSITAPFGEPLPAALDRTCDTCGGRGSRMVEAYTTNIPADIDCPDCDGTGRHTFAVDVKHFDLMKAALAASDPVVERLYNSPRILRIHVIDVLPIYGEDVSDESIPDGQAHIVHNYGFNDFDLFTWRDDIAFWECEESITLPSAAQPGMWLVRLAIHTPKNVEET